MRRSPVFAHVGNVATSGFLGSGNRHFFRYFPRDYSPDRKWPLLVFLHGASGNVALYPWLWSRFADEKGFVILCPTWDNGEWWRPGGVQLALDALDDTLKSCAIDESRVFLAGHSNGAAGGWDVLAARQRAFRGFVAISGGNPARGLAQDVGGIPVLLLHGTADDATPAAASREFCRRLAAAGRRVELVEIEGEDHFLLVRSTDTVANAVWNWMSQLR